MKRVLLVLGLILAVLMVFRAANFAPTFVKIMALRGESRVYVDEVAPKLLADGSKETLLAYASDDVKNSVKTEEMDKVCALLQKLGRFKEYRVSAEHVHISPTPQGGKVITGRYVLQAQFDSGRARVEITVVKEGDRWFVHSFAINSLVLLAQQRQGHHTMEGGIA